MPFEERSTRSLPILLNAIEISESLVVGFFNKFGMPDFLGISDFSFFDSSITLSADVFAW